METSYITSSSSLAFRIEALQASQTAPNRAVKRRVRQRLHKKSGSPGAHGDAGDGPMVQRAPWICSERMVNKNGPKI